MSWLRCKCGYEIYDITDYICYKGRIMADQDHFDYMDSVAEIIESKNPDRRKLLNDFYCKFSDMAKIVYQCSECGRLYIESDNEFSCFVPENHNDKGALKSVHGEKWKGFLHAEWNDKKPEWQECRGYVCADVNYPCESIHSDDINEIIDGYYRILDGLKKAGVIRYASLKMNGKLIHEWDIS